MAGEVLRWILSRGEEEERNRLLREQYAAQLEPLRNLPGDITSLFQAAQGGTQPLLGTVPAEDVDRTMGLADATRTVPGAQTLPALAGRMGSQAFGRIATFRPQLLATLGLKSPADAEKEKRQREGHALFAQVLTGPAPKNREEAQARFSNLVRVAAEHRLDFADDLLRTGMKTLLEAPDESVAMLGAIGRRFSAHPESQTNFDKAFTESIFAAAQEYPKAGKPFLDVAKQAKELFKREKPQMTTIEG